MDSVNMITNGMSKYFTRRDKKGKGVATEMKEVSRVFTLDEKKKLSKEEEKTVQEILGRLEDLHFSGITEDNVRFALQQPSAQGNPDKAFDLLQLYNATLNREIVQPSSLLPLVGAENRNSVTCYLDSLLFAMFARLDTFESILKVEFPDPATNSLATLIRLWVNMLRTGKLITTDVVKHLQEALADCGWEDARNVKQQDVSEAFTFITGKLSLPLLTLKMDVYHTGKESQDDHRTINERLLDVAIPTELPEDGKPPKLESCLETFFNNYVHVRRHLQRRNTVGGRPQQQSSEKEESETTVEEVNPISTPAAAESYTAESIFRHKKKIAVNPSKTARKGAQDDSSVTYGKKVYREQNEILMPAFQFFKYVPFFHEKRQSDEQVPLTSDEQVAQHFATRQPTVGICLKRYTCDADGPKRLDTKIDIPLDTRLPHFVSNGQQDDGFGSSFSKFKLSLMSVIFHRGSSLDAGHYVSAARPSPEDVKIAGQPPDSQWLFFDDLASPRISKVNIHELLDKECPYLLFYQVLPRDDEDDDSWILASAEAENAERGPLPTYSEATSSRQTITDTLNGEIDHNPPAISQAASPSMGPLGIDTRPNPHILVESLSNSVQPPALMESTTTASNSMSNTPLLQARTTPESAMALALNTERIRPGSLELPPPSYANPEYRKSQELPASHRSSVTFTDSSIGRTPITSPNEDSIKEKEAGYISGNAETPQVISPSKKRGRGLFRGSGKDEEKDGAKEKDALKEKDGEKSKNRGSWLGIGTKRSKNDLPGATASEENNRVVSGVSEKLRLMTTSLRGAKSREPMSGKDGSVITSEQNSPTDGAAMFTGRRQSSIAGATTVANTIEVQHPIAATTAASKTKSPRSSKDLLRRSGSMSAVTTLKDKDKAKDKGNFGSVRRHKSLHTKGKGRNGTREHSPKPGSAGSDDEKDRQCVLM